MALITNPLPEQSHPKNQLPKHNHKNQQQKQEQKQKQKQKQKPKQKPPSSWDQIKNILTCKQIEGSKVHDPSKPNNNNGYSKLGSSCSSICSFRDVVHGNTRVVHRSDNSSPESSILGQETSLLKRKPVTASSSSSSTRSASCSGKSSNGGRNYTTSSSSSSRRMQFRKLSGCYECHMIVDPSRLPIPRSTVCACDQCGEVFPKIESLELHQAVRHAVSELGLEDSGRNIVEIIFKSSWLKRESPMCNIERILKVHNTQRTIQRFEECRDSVKSRAASTTKKNPRCAADGNELLRFHSTTLSCALGARGSSALCAAVPGCGVCTIIRHGFQNKGGVKTNASSGMAHDNSVGRIGEDSRRAMLVCRVIAGKVKRAAEEGAAPVTLEEENVAFDSVAGNAGIYSNLEDLTVFNPKAILPCFVVIYKVLS
ncbi:unnamed protein product [Trifolium pratense]|uniref:Uncharacterized protein n=1 Tax=Trifolium pratense TaxID=57577 RepID=A0ACB0M597_TRIPR|nr:unnamed protein product [Trifolium pratense]